MNSDEFHMKLNPNHVHVSHRGQVDHEEHHVVRGRAGVTRGEGTPVAGLYLIMLLVGAGVKAETSLVVVVEVGTHPLPQGDEWGRAATSLPGLSSPGPGSPEDQVIVMNMERQRALDREAQALALYSMQMRELLENQQGMYHPST